MTKITLQDINQQKEELSTKKDELSQIFEQKKKELLDTLARDTENIKNNSFIDNKEKEKIIANMKKKSEKLIEKIENELNTALSKLEKDFSLCENGYIQNICEEINENIKSKQDRQEGIKSEIETERENLRKLEEEIKKAQDRISGLETEASQISHKISEIKTTDIFDYKINNNLTAIKNDLVNTNSFSKEEINDIIRKLKSEKNGFKDKEICKVPYKHIEKWTDNEEKINIIITIIKNYGYQIIYPSGMRKINQEKTKNSRQTTTYSSNNYFQNLTQQHNTLALNNIKGKITDFVNINEKQAEEFMKCFIDLFKLMGFSFKNEEAFINQAKSAYEAGIKYIYRDLCKCLNELIQNNLKIESRFTKEKGTAANKYFRIALDCVGMNPRILLTQKENKKYEFVCLVPHHIYDKMLRGEITNTDKTYNTRRDVKGSK